MASCDRSPFGSNSYKDSTSTSRDSDVPGTISLDSSLDGISCAGWIDVISHNDCVVEANYTGNGDLEFIKIQSELTINGIEVSVSAGTGGANGNFNVSGNSITYTGKFEDNNPAEYNAFDLEGTALGITSVVQRDTATFRIDGVDYRIDNVIDLGL